MFQSFFVEIFSFFATTSRKERASEYEQSTLGAKKEKFTKKTKKMVRWPSGKAAVCKTAIRGFDSRPHLINIGEIMTKTTKTIAVYPGSFDPITNGHIDIIKRASRIFDEVIVALLINNNKKPLLNNDDRKKLIDLSVKGMKNVRTDKFSGLLVDYMKKVGAKTAIRGLRAVSDLEYEFQIAHTNRKLYKDMETVFLMPSSNYVFLSSSIVRQVYSMGGDLDTMLPLHVSKLLKKKYKNGK